MPGPRPDLELQLPYAMWVGAVSQTRRDFVLDRGGINSVAGIIPPMARATSGARLQSMTDIYDAATCLWVAAGELRAYSYLKAADYAIPALGLIFLNHAAVCRTLV
jgi:hypothetical protein